MRNFKEEYQRWLDSPALSDAEWKELDAIRDDEKEIESRFFAPLEFGTAGLRGTMKVGLHHMNVHVIRWATQAFANVICAEGEEAKRKGIAVAHDCRLNGEDFAREAACVMAANGIHVRIFDALRPTPELSFAVRYYGCTAGLNVTASHNPKEYNGYKVYWQDGAQLPPKHADAISARLNEIDIFNDVKTMPYYDAVRAGLIERLGTETDEKFLANVMEQVNDYESVKKVADSFKVVFTPFHGTGHKLIPEALYRLGIKNLYCEPQQMVIDGNFPTVKSPNPENPEGFALAVELAKKVGADFIIGSDPDADRLGLMVRTSAGDFKVLSGNQIGVLLLDYIIGAKKRAGIMPKNPTALKSLVSTEMARKVCEMNGLQCFDTFTGFKFLAEKKDKLEKSGEGNVIISFEESNGYMVGSYCRDKDSIGAAMLVAEMAAYYATQGKTLADAMDELYAKYGYFSEHTYNLVMPGLDGLKDMAELMRKLREEPPTELSGVKILVRKDYKDGSAIDTATGKKETMELSNSNVLRFEMADGTSVIVRPSGTEPKVKVYVLAQGKDAAEAKANNERYGAWVKSLQK